MAKPSNTPISSCVDDDSHLVRHAMGTVMAAVLKPLRSNVLIMILAGTHG